MERRGRGLLPLSSQIAAGAVCLRLYPASFPSFSFDFTTSSSVWSVTNQSRDNNDPKNHLRDCVRLSREPTRRCDVGHRHVARLPFNGRVNKKEIERCLQLLASSQHGVVGLRQLLDGGVSRGSSGVFAIEGASNRSSPGSFVWMQPP